MSFQAQTKSIDAQANQRTNGNSLYEQIYDRVEDAFTTVS